MPAQLQLSYRASLFPTKALAVAEERLAVAEEIQLLYGASLFPTKALVVAEERRIGSKPWF